MHRSLSPRESLALSMYASRVILPHSRASNFLVVQVTVELGSNTQATAVGHTFTRGSGTKQANMADYLVDSTGVFGV